MTTTSPNEAVETVTGTIDGVEITVPKGTMIIRAAELIGTEVPRFCDHPLLEPVAACRACLVEIEGMPKPQPSCAIALGDGMVVSTGESSEVAATAQEAVLEYLLINHPLDCPVCDKGGECPLQNQAMSHGPGESRFTLPKRHFAKPVSLSTEILLDRERCVSCARCTRFAEQIAGDPLIALTARGANQQIGIGEEPFDSYFSGNTVQICPVGALTSTAYRFQSRPFDLVSVPTTCEHCASGCALRTDYRNGKVRRRLAWDDPEVNEEWNCDKGRFAFTYAEANRLRTPLVREDGRLRPASWPEALRVAADGLAAARGRAAVLPGGRLTLEDAYAYARFARTVLGTNDIDARARATGADEAGFLGAHVAGGAGPTYRDLEAAATVLLVAFEPEDESPIVFLRLRKAAGAGTKVHSLAAYASAGLRKLHGELIPVVPGGEAAAVADLPADLVTALSAPGAVIMVGERAAALPGTLAAVAALRERTGATLAWVPRRAGERGAVDAGCLPGLLPGGRPVTDAAARADVAAVWGLAADDLAAMPGRTLAEVVAAVENDVAMAHADADLTPEIAALLIAGVEAGDLPDPEGFLEAVRQVPFVVSLETRPTEITAAADVVLPVGVVTEKAGTFVDWEGRRRPFPQVFDAATSFTDATVLALLAEQLDLTVPSTVAQLRAEIERLGGFTGDRPWTPTEVPQPAAPQPGEAVLATWRALLDLGALQDNEPHLAGTRRPPVARISPATAAALGVSAGEAVRVASDHGAITLPCEPTDMPDHVVWLPGNAPDSRVASTLRVGAGQSVRLERGA